MSFKQNIETVARAVKLARIARVAGKIKRSEGEDRDAAKRALAELLADARGVPMKIGQFLANRSEGDAFDVLVEGIPPQPLADMGPTLDAAFADSLAQTFESIEESQAAASLGQVHKATLRDGRVVAIKLRYPGIAAAVGAELRLAGLLPGVGPAKKWGFDLGGYKTALKENMDRELDYRSEAQRQRRFRERVAIPGLIVPEVFPDLCSEGALVQAWESGQRIREAAAWPPEERRRLGEILMATFFTSLFVHGQVHCDPNEGNLFVRRNARGEPEVVLLDYGCMVEIDERPRRALLKLILGCADGDDTDPLLCFAEFGFDAQKLVPISEVLPALCMVLFEPFLQDDPYSTKYWELNTRTEALLGELRWWFRSAGPPSQFLLMRAFSGLVSHLRALQIILPWRTVLLRTLGNDVISRARNFRPAPLPEGIERTGAHFDSLAKFLKILVMEGDRQVARVSMPASQVADLETLVPEDVLEKLREASIDVKEIARKACDSGIVPQELFSLTAGARQYRVWLE